MNPLAVQLYSVRDLMTPDPTAVLERITAAGYGAVEPYNVLDNPEGFKSIVDRLGLKVCSAHTPLLADGGAQQDTLFDAVATIGTDTAIVAASPAEQWTSREGVQGIADGLNAAAEKAAGRGIRVGYHNHFWELENQIDGRFAIEVFADLLDPRVILEVDTYWAQVGGADVVPLLQRLGERVRYLHVKDGPAKDRSDSMVAVGSGDMPVVEILGANPAVEWHVVELDRCDTDMVQAIADSATYLAGVR